MDLSNAISAVQEITFQQTFHSLKNYFNRNYTVYSAINKLKVCFDLIDFCFYINWKSLALICLADFYRFRMVHPRMRSAIYYPWSSHWLLYCNAWIVFILLFLSSSQLIWIISKHGSSNLRLTRLQIPLLSVVNFAIFLSLTLSQTNKPSPLPLSGA